MVGKDTDREGIGKILLGFAILMTGMNTMSNAMSPWRTSPGSCTCSWLHQPHSGRAGGALLTAVIQSSSASVGILQALTATGAVTYAAAIPIIMGQNIGTCVTALISSAGANKNARRTAMVHLYFNIIGTRCSCAGFYGLNAVFQLPLTNQANAFGIAIVHTVFNM